MSLCPTREFLGSGDESDREIGTVHATPQQGAKSKRKRQSSESSTKSAPKKQADAFKTPQGMTKPKKQSFAGVFAENSAAKLNYFKEKLSNIQYFRYDT